jgi:uncharacterized small protein (TIGR04563 family)
MPPTTDKRKQSLYFPEDMLREIQEEASRQDRSMSWIVQQAWKVSREQIARVPGVENRTPPAPTPVVEPTRV